EAWGGEGVEWAGRGEAPEVGAEMGRERARLLPPAWGGLPRIVIESFMRGRAVVGSRAGGTPDIVDDGLNGLLVPPGDATALADAVERILDDDSLAARRGAGAAASAAPWRPTPPACPRRRAAPGG